MSVDTEIFAFDDATLERAIKRYNAQRSIYATLRAYSRGEQELKYLDDDVLKENGKELRGTRENLCAAAISAFVNPLQISSWGSEANDDLARTSRLTSALKTSWAEAHRCGAGYIVDRKVGQDDEAAIQRGWPRLTQIPASPGLG